MKNNNSLYKSPLSLLILSLQLLLNKCKIKSKKILGILYSIFDTRIRLNTGSKYSKILELKKFPKIFFCSIFFRKRKRDNYILKYKMKNK